MCDNTEWRAHAQCLQIKGYVIVSDEPTQVYILLWRYALLPQGDVVLKMLATGTTERELTQHPGPVKSFSPVKVL